MFYLSTMNAILLVGLVAGLLTLAVMAFTKVLQSPPQVFVGLGMIGVGYLVLRDIMKLSDK